MEEDVVIADTSELRAFIQAAEDLAKNIETDIKYNASIVSTETIHALSCLAYTKQNISTFFDLLTSMVTKKEGMQ
jgi:hypothetical protein